MLGLPVVSLAAIWLGSLTFLSKKVSVKPNGLSVITHRALEIEGELLSR